METIHILCVYITVPDRQSGGLTMILCPQCLRPHICEPAPQMLSKHLMQQGEGRKPHSSLPTSSTHPSTDLQLLTTVNFLVVRPHNLYKCFKNISGADDSRGSYTITTQERLTNSLWCPFLITLIWTVCCCVALSMYWYSILFSSHSESKYFQNQHCS